jgi:hypothetical protein
MVQRVPGILGAEESATLTRDTLVWRSTATPRVMQQSVYGQSVPQFADEQSRKSPSNLSAASDQGAAAVHVDQRLRNLRRVALKDIPAVALVPPVAAAATTALVAAPGGAAALSAIQRGAVTQALQEAGVQLGALLSSSDVGRSHRAHDGDARVHEGILGISQESRVALDMLLLDVCRTLGCTSIPLLYIRPDTVARAHFLALPKNLPEASESVPPISWGLHPSFVLTSTVLELLDREELRALFGSLLAFALTPGGLGFDASGSESLLELAIPVLDTIGAPVAFLEELAIPETQLDRRSSRGSICGHAVTRRVSTSPSRMHATGPRLSSAHTLYIQSLQTSTLAAAATAVALQDLAPGLLNRIGVSREEREWKARGGWNGEGLEALTRRAAPLLRMVADRGALLAAQVAIFLVHFAPTKFPKLQHARASKSSFFIILNFHKLNVDMLLTARKREVVSKGWRCLQDFGVVERMMVKMECGTASLIRHISLPSLRSAAQNLLESSTLTHSLGLYFISQQSSGPTSIQVARSSTGGQHRQSAAQQRSQNSQQRNRKGAASTRRSSVDCRDTHNEQPAEEKGPGEALQVWAQQVAAGDLTVLRFAALQRWVASGEYESLVDRCAHKVWLS